MESGGKVIEAPVGATLGRDNPLIPIKTIASTARSYNSYLALTTPSFPLASGSRIT